MSSDEMTDQELQAWLRANYPKEDERHARTFRIADQKFFRLIQKNIR